MENAKPFYDLCVHEKVAIDFNSFAKKCVEFGYKTIAIDHVMDVTPIDSSKEARKKNRKGEDRGFNRKQDSHFVRRPIKPSIKDLDLTVLNRITVVCNDKEVLSNIMQQENFRMYDIFALNPKSNELLHSASDITEADIITFDPFDIKGIKLTRKIYNKAAAKGMHFEIMYYPAIVDQTARKNIITKSHVYHQVGKSENIIITSGCTSVITLRGPYDIINLGLIFGLTEEKSKQSITSTGAAVLKHAMGRKIGKAIVFISEIKGNESSTVNITDVDSDETSGTVEPIQKKLKTNDVIILDP